MKVVILAGGYGNRLFEETISKPKPMVEIGGMPILWHIMKIYSAYGFREFIICMGYKQEVIIEYFRNNFAYVKEKNKYGGENNKQTFYNKVDDWKITLVDTGIETLTGGRVKKISSLIGNDTFLLSYGDTLGNINIRETINFHKENNVIVTLSAVQPRSNYGVIHFNTNKKTVKNFKEKPIESNQWINGGFYVVEPEFLNYIEGDYTSFELEPFEKIVKQNKLAAYKHNGFWKSIETYKDKLILEDLWSKNEALWNLGEQNLGKVL